MPLQAAKLTQVFNFLPPKRFAYANTVTVQTSEVGATLATLATIPKQEVLKCYVAAQHFRKIRVFCWCVFVERSKQNNTSSVVCNLSRHLKCYVGTDILKVLYESALYINNYMNSYSAQL